MSDTLTVPPPVERKCRVEHLLDRHCLALLERVPNNPLLRALLLKLTGELPPPECVTFPELKDWIETHCELKRRVSHAPAAHLRRRDGIAITVEFADTEYGRADYSVRRHGREPFHLPAVELMEQVREAIAAEGGLDEVVERVAGRIDNDAWEECDPSMDDSGDYDYNNHDSSNTEDSDVSFDRGELRRAILAFVRERHPELAAEL